MVAVASTDLFSFQPSHPSPAWGSRTHYEAKSYRGLFCGNDGINNFDVNGNSWLSKLWDHTILKIGQQAAINWDHQGRTVAEAIGVIVASYFIGAEAADLMYSAGTSATISASGAMIVTPADTGLLAGSVSSASMSFGTASTLATVTGGAVGGFAGGALSTALAGGNLSQTLSAGGRDAALGAAFAFGGSELLNVQAPSAPSWGGAANAAVTSAARYGVNAFAEKQLGINGWEFDAGLEAISYLGYKAFGDPYQGPKGDSSFIGGFGQRDPSTGWLFQGAGNPTASGWLKDAHYWGEFLFDANDQVLQWQGLPDAGLIAYAHHGWALPNAGFSLGASRGTTANSMDLGNGMPVYALPFGEVSMGPAFIGNGDAVTGFSFGRIFNPNATILNVPFITGHDWGIYSNGAGVGP
jgi:hypothetical protein